MRQMKNSGIEWIGEIPETWGIVLLSSIFYQHKEKNSSLQETNLLSLSYGKIIKKDINTCEGLLPASFETYNIIDNGDIVFRLTDLQNDQRSLRTGLCTQKGIITSAYITLRNNIELDDRYMHYLYHSYDICKVFYRMGDGVRQGMNFDDLKKLLTLFPPVSEQQKIADFLDDKCAKIDCLIAHEEATIEELKAYKQSVITEAVTKGLDKSVPMKDSGVEWIGKIPKAWEIKKAKFLADIFSKGSGITKEDIVSYGDSPCVRYGEIYTKYDTHFESCVTRTNLSNVPSPQYFSYGDILFVCTGELVEEIGKNIVYLGNERCLAGGDIIVMKHSYNPLYLSFALNSHISQCQKSCNKAKLKVVHISLGDIGNTLVAVPPLKEQKQIADYLDKKCADIDNLISIKLQKIEELKEYKKSLIYEYVTGKKEVA